MTTQDRDRLDAVSEQRQKLVALIEQRPELFEKIDLADYSSKPALADLDEERLTEGDQANWVTVDDEQNDCFQTYRFHWSDVEQFGILPI